MGVVNWREAVESKIRIKMGPIEIEFEGSEDFLKSELPTLIANVSALYQSADIPEDDATSGTAPPSSQGSDLQLSTNSIAAKLHCKSGPELAVAAAAHLTLVAGKQVFTRKELLDEMKTASGYYKSSYMSNLTKTLNQLVKSKFNEPSNGKYALTAAAAADIRAKIA